MSGQIRMTVIADLGYSTVSLTISARPCNCQLSWRRSLFERISRYAKNIANKGRRFILMRAGMPGKTSAVKVAGDLRQGTFFKWIKGRGAFNLLKTIGKQVEGHEASGNIRQGFRQRAIGYCQRCIRNASHRFFLSLGDSQPQAEAESGAGVKLAPDEAGGAA